MRAVVGVDARSGTSSSNPRAGCKLGRSHARRLPVKPNTRELRALGQRDPHLAAALSKLPRFPGFPDRENARQRSHYVSLASAIIYQQLHGKAAATIYARVCALTPGSAFPKPADLLTLSERELRTAGLSRNKLVALRDLAERIEGGRLELARISRRSDDEIIERLTEVRGIGTWSAQMFLMFRLGRLDVMPAGDLGVREGLRLLDGLGERPAPEQAMARAEVWRPLRSVGAWAMWQLVDARRAQAATAVRDSRAGHPPTRADSRTVRTGPGPACADDGSVRARTDWVRTRTRPSPTSDGPTRAGRRSARTRVVAAARQGR